jgi:7,8-dihydroneopterin aldolase/epimerase/oxygenase
VGDRILLQDLVFYGYHGVKPAEKSLGQRFGVDLEIETDLGPAGRLDDLALTVDYGEVFRVVRELVEGPSRGTLEALAEATAAALLERFERIQSVAVRVRKPCAPIAGAQGGTVAVEIKRRRQGGGGE